ncbi:MAG: transposase [Anaerolineales bacterium]|nr:transposase [Anaerolineales bacterium]
MSAWKPNFDPDHLYFVTTKAVDYLHIFQRDVIKRRGCRLRAHGDSFVIMPNHTHFTGQFTKDDPLADVMRDFKKYTSDRILRQLKAGR